MKNNYDVATGPTDLGQTSQPRRMKAPSENHRLLRIVKSLEKVGPCGLSSICHSLELNRLTRNRTQLTARYENMIDSQTFTSSGSMNENTPGFCFSGFLIMMLMPSCMNGLLKSTTRSRIDVIVSGAIAMSASCATYSQNHAIPPCLSVSTFWWLNF